MASGEQCVGSHLEPLKGAHRAPGPRRPTRQGMRWHRNFWAHVMAWTPVDPWGPQNIMMVADDWLMIDDWPMVDDDG